MGRADMPKPGIGDDRLMVSVLSGLWSVLHFLHPSPSTSTSSSFLDIISPQSTTAL